MKNIEEKILMVDEEIKQLQNKRKKLTSQQKQEERKKRDKRIYEKGAVFENSFTDINVNLKMYKSGNLKMYNFTHLIHLSIGRIHP